MTAGAAVYSPGYQLTLWLGSGQLRLWRRLDRLLGAQSSGTTTVRGLARDTGANPGAVSRDLGRLAALGFVVRSTRLGRAGGVSLWRVVSRRSRELAGRARALRRMRAPMPGQLVLATAEGRVWWDTEPDAEPEVGAPVSAPGVPESDRSPDPGSERDPEIVTEAELGLTDITGAYGIERCGCGRPRITYDGAVPGPCPHDR